MHKFLILFLLLLNSCVTIPEGIKPISNFDKERYLGKWHEIARLDHSFERGLSRITADYSLRDDGGIRVINKGLNIKTNQWKEAEGKAYFVQSPSDGYLKVSFFGPFYGSYIIFQLDENYQHAYISGPDKDYLWLLSRTPTVPKNVLENFIQVSAKLGFDTNALIYNSND